MSYDTADSGGGGSVRNNEFLKSYTAKFWWSRNVAACTRLVHIRNGIPHISQENTLSQRWPSHLVLSGKIVISACSTILCFIVRKTKS